MRSEVDLNGDNLRISRAYLRTSDHCSVSVRVRVGVADCCIQTAGESDKMRINHVIKTDCVVECRICNREVVGSNLGLGHFAPRSTQPSIPPGSINEYQLRLGRQRQVWLIPVADERVVVQIKL